MRLGPATKVIRAVGHIALIADDEKCGRLKCLFGQKSRAKLLSAFQPKLGMDASCIGCFRDGSKRYLNSSRKFDARIPTLLSGGVLNCSPRNRVARLIAIGC